MERERRAFDGTAAIDALLRMAGPFAKQLPRLRDGGAARTIENDTKRSLPVMLQEQHDRPVEIRIRQVG